MSAGLPGRMATKMVWRWGLLAWVVLAAGCAAPNGYFDAEPASIENIFRKTGVTKKDVIADLASMDGAAAVIAAKYGMRSVAYPNDLIGYAKLKHNARKEGVEDRVSVDWLKRDLSLHGANVIFYAPSRFFNEDDLSAAIKQGAMAGKIFSTNRLRVNVGISNLLYLGEEDGLQIYRWGPPPSVRDTVPPPKDVVYPIPPKPAQPAKPKAGN